MEIFALLEQLLRWGRFLLFVDSTKSRIFYYMNWIFYCEALIYPIHVINSGGG
jgi:hypothetical protein